MSFFPRFAFAIFLPVFVGSCNQPSAAESPRMVAARDLHVKYIEEPRIADLAFTNRTIQVLVTGFTVAGNEIQWRPRYTTPMPPARIVFRFPFSPKVTAPCVIEGRCLGQDRTVIVLIDCSIVKNATPPAP